MRNKWEGITLELLKKADAPLAFKQRFEGADEATKVLVHNEQVNIDGVLVKIGGFEYEVELTAEEAIQNIKNISSICKVIREEITAFIDYGVETKTKIDGIMAAEVAAKTPTTEEAPAPEAVVSKDVATQIKEGIAAALAGLGINKS
jgi:hypothetical protein